MSTVNRREFLLQASGASLGLQGVLGTSRRRPDVTVRRFEERDAGAVLAMLEPRYANEHPILMRRGRALHTPQGTSPGFHRTLVAESDGAIVGVGSAMAQAWHPRYYLADVMVHESARRRGVGTQLLAGVREEVARADARRLFAQIRPDGDAGRAFDGARPFATRRGFSLLMRSRQWRIDTNSTAVADWAARQRQSSHGYEIRTNLESRDPRVIGVIRQLYDWMHRDWSPLGNISAAQFDQAFGPAILPGSACLAEGDGQVVGVGCLMRTADPGLPMRPLISMLGPTDPRLPRARELSADLVARCIAFARGREREIEAEADDAHTALVPVLEAMPATVVGELLQLADG